MIRILNNNYSMMNKREIVFYNHMINCLNENKKDYIFYVDKYVASIDFIKEQKKLRRLIDGSNGTSSRIVYLTSEGLNCYYISGGKAILHNQEVLARLEQSVN